jgi:hypothetical protein
MVLQSSDSSGCSYTAFALYLPSGGRRETVIVLQSGGYGATE